MIDLGIEMRAREDPEARVGGARLLDDLPRLERIRHGDEQHARFAEIGGAQHLGGRGVA